MWFHNEEYRLLDILLSKHKAIICEQNNTDRFFLDQMVHKGYLKHYDTIEDKNYYHVNGKFKEQILEMLKKNL